MTDLTPAETLHAAAERLRRLARVGDFRPTPWQAGQQTVTKIRAFDANRTPLAHAGPGRDLSGWFDPEVAHYIVAMHPGVGLLVADWLDATAGEMQAADGTEYEYSEFASWTAALAVARALLGQVTP